MNLNFAKYVIIILLLVSCRNQETEVKNYGFPKNESGALDVSLKLSEFKNYGILIDRIREITCNDSIPKITIKQKSLILNVFPTEHCEPMIFDPASKHYVTFRKGKPYEWQTIIEILPDSLNKKLIDDFSYYRNSKKLENYLIIIKSNRKEKINGIEKFIKDLTQEYDKLSTELELNFAFWEEFPYLTPPQ